VSSVGRKPDMIEVIVNGRPHRGPAGLTVADAVAALTTAGAGAPAAAAPPAAGRGIAVAVNGEVVRRADWPATRLAPGDEVEVLTAVQGG
jgi:sulfur carrier protein